MYSKQMVSVCSCMLLLVLVLTSCGVTVGLDSKTREMLQQAIDELARQPARWDEVLTGLSSQVSEDAKSVIRTLKAEMTDFSREVIEDSGIEIRCNTDFIGQRVRSALQQILDNDELTYTLSPWICHLRPEAFSLDAVGLPTESILTITGFGFTPDNVGNAQIMVADEQGNVFEQLNVTPNFVSSYRMTVNIQQLPFPTNPRNKLRVNWLGDEGYVTEAAILVDESTPTPPPPALVVLTGAAVDFFTQDDNKDGDTRVNINLVCDGSTIAAVSDTWGEFGEHSESGWKPLVLVQQPELSQIGRNCRFDLVENPNGRDEWHFDWALALRFSDGTTRRYDFQGGNVDYDRNYLSVGLP